MPLIASNQSLNEALTHCTSVPSIREIACTARARFKASVPHWEQFEIRAINDHIALNLFAAAPAEVRNKLYLCYHQNG